MGEYSVKASEVAKRTKPTILLIDTNNILWRTAAIAIKNYQKDMVVLRQKSLDGVSTPKEDRLYDQFFNEFVLIWKNIVFSMIRNIVNTHKPNSVILCRDASLTWRLLFYPYYKGLRRLNSTTSDYDSPYSRDRFYAEVEKTVKSMNDILNYHELLCPLLEADDIIAVLAQKVSIHYNIIISSTDKDFADLITDDESVKFWEHHKKSFLTKEDKPDFDEMILIGDGADGIPRLHDEDDSIVMFRDYTEEEMKLPEIKREKIKREFIKSPSSMRPRFGLGAAKKIIVQNKKDNITLEEYAKKNGYECNYIRNKCLFSLRLEDLTTFCPDVITTVKDKFLELTVKTQSYIDMQKFFAKSRMLDQLSHIDEFILPTFVDKQ
jgi:hypothetical protein